MMLALALAACGGDDDSAATTSITTSISTSISTTSIATTSIATTSNPTDSTASSFATTPVATAEPEAVTCGSGPAIDPDGSLREQFVGYLASCGFTPEEAACLFDNLDFSDPSVAGGESGPIVAAFGTCGIDQARAAEIGG
jgi:hypothetical protein